MAGTISVQSSIQVTNSPLNYSSNPRSFSAVQNNIGGPIPGTVTAVTTGTGVQLTLSGLTTPGMLFIQNLDSTNYVTLGIVVSGTFYPVVEIQPGEFYVFRMSRTILSAATLWVLANTASCKVLVQAFEN